MKALLINRSSERLPRKFLDRWFKELTAALKKSHGAEVRGKDVVVVFADPKEIRALNRRFRGKNRPTDILSFAPVEDGQLGELVVCPQVIREQAKDTGLGVRGELGYMIVHGCLHLLGYEHEDDPKAAKVMFALQDRLFAVVAARMKLR